MTYQPLARKYRPARFADVIGQEAVSQALANAIKLGREPHAVVFAGTRGIGKTTTARLYAKSLNCDQGPTADPCNACESCVAITRGVHEDVLEIDGASNTGVGDVRALQETIDYVPQRSKFKVYIIDEVHMLSQAAFNALLKTLEEPPSHVVFIFATTELGRVPQTIISRCQVFHLQKLPMGLIRQGLVAILNKEALAFEDKAVSIIAREGHGSMRDALTLLDQAIALGGGQVTLASLGSLVSNLSSSPYLDLLDAMTRRDANIAMSVIATLDQGGVEFASAVEEAAKFARHAFVVRDLGAKALDQALLGLDDDEVGRLQAIAAASPPFDLNRIFRSLGRCRTELDGSALDRYVVENYIFEWCLDPGLPDLTSLINGRGGEVTAATRTSRVTTAKQPSPSAEPTLVAPVLSQQSHGLDHVPSAPPPVNSKLAAPQRMRDIMAEIKSPQTSARPPGPANQPTATPEVKNAEASRSSQSMMPPSPTASAPAQAAKLSPLAPHARAGATVQNSHAARPSSKRELAEQFESAPPIGQVTSASGVFPKTWRELVDAWKQRKPLQARKLEEVHPVIFSATQITIAVSEDGFASKSLLQRDEQLRVMEHFRELFGFTGQLTVIAKADAEAAAPAEAEHHRPEPSLRSSSELLPETLLKVKEREGGERREQLIDSARKAAFTQEVLAVFGATIEDVSLRE